MSKTAFVFSGQGAQCVGMGKDFYENSRAAKDIFDAADKALGRSVSGICFNGPQEELTASKNCQPAIYTTSMACLAAFQERYPDVKPAAAAGLSLGEYAALTAAGCFGFEDGLKLVAKRGLFMDEACKENPGAMACILGGNPEDIEAACAEADVDVANYNCPGQIVISGPADKIQKACELIQAKKVKRVVPLKVAGAFHSRLMQPACDKFAEALKGVKIRKPSVPAAQNYVGGIVEDENVIAENLIRQVAGSVRLESCIRDIVAKTQADVFVEFGPGNVVSGLVHKIEPSVKVFNVSSLADLDKIVL